MYDVANVGRGHRLEAAFASAAPTRRGIRSLRDVVQDLVFESLPDDRRRHLARPEPGDFGRLGVALRYFGNLGRHDLRGHFEGQLLAGLTDLGELGFHQQSIMSDGPGPLLVARPGHRISGRRAFGPELN